MTTDPGPSRPAPPRPPSPPPSRPITPTPASPPTTPRPVRNHLAVNAREYLADLEVLTTRALHLADRYEKQIKAALTWPAGVR